MIVSCDNCAARYKLDPARITGRGVRITCPRCKNVFVVYNQAQQDDEVIETAPADPSEPTPAPARPQAQARLPSASSSATSKPSTPPPPSAAAPAPPRGDIGSLDFASVGIQAWKVKVAIGLVYDFSDYKTLARYIKDGRVGEGDRISHDGKNWTVLGEIDDLEEHFFQVYEEAERRMQAGGSEPEPDAFDEDSPTMIVGASDVASSLKGIGSVAADDSGPSSPVDDYDDEHASGISAAMSAALEAEDGGAPVPVGPRFQDPFDRARSERSASGKRRRSAPASSSGRGEAAPSKGRGRKGLLAFIAAGVLVGVVGVGAWLQISARQAELDLQARQAEEERQAELKAKQQEIQESAGQALVDKVNEELEDAITTSAEEIVYEDPDEVRIPVGPNGPVQQSGTAVDLGDGSSGTVSTSAATPDDHYQAGRTAYSSGKYTAAISAFSKAAAGSPGNGTYYKWLGLAQMKQGDGGAAASLSKAASLGATDAYIYLGELSQQQGDVAGAIGYFEQYLSHDPGNASVQARIDALTR